ncbi:MAG: hypothetical protein FWE35_01005 [Streptosporangiales bacterium]|nr:hypothetical protein [Streptosporangiales bacterium]
MPGNGHDDQAETVVQHRGATIRLTGNATLITSDGPMTFTGFPPRLAGSAGDVRVTRAGDSSAAGEA